MQANQTSVIWTVIICSAILLILGGFATYNLGKDVELAVVQSSNIDAPTSEEIANSILAGLPSALTAEEVAALLPAPYQTDWSVKEAKKAKANELAIEEMEEKDFKKALATFLTKYPTKVSIDWNDIEEYEVKDVDVTILPPATDGDEALVEVDFKVSFLNYGDEPEKARVIVFFNVVGLDWEDDFKDAEVTGWHDWKLVRFYGDLS